jgi:hypothetical protein
MLAMMTQAGREMDTTSFVELCGMAINLWPNYPCTALMNDRLTPTGQATVKKRTTWLCFHTPDTTILHFLY